MVTETIFSQRQALQMQNKNCFSEVSNTTIAKSIAIIKDRLQNAKYWREKHCLVDNMAASVQYEI